MPVPRSNAVCSQSTVECSHLTCRQTVVLSQINTYSALQRPRRFYYKQRITTYFTKDLAGSTINSAFISRLRQNVTEHSVRSSNIQPIVQFQYFGLPWRHNWMSTVSEPCGYVPTPPQSKHYLVTQTHKCFTDYTRNFARTYSHRRNVHIWFANMYVCSVWK